MVRFPAVRSVSQPVNGVRPATSCSSCCLQGVCLPCGLASANLSDLDELTTVKRRIARGASLYRGGDEFDALYAVRSGAFKTVGVSRNGEEKITGFYLPGEVMGMDAINNERHNYSAAALEDSEVCVIPFARLTALTLRIPELQQQLFRLLSRDIARDHGLMLLLGSMTAEQRLAAFLLSLSRRYKRLGYAADRFMLRMTREDIGNYLGLTLETVSRLMSRFQRDGLITAQQREVEFKDFDGLMDMVGHW
ncbi:MAG: fumarate/nitrate reduction transcriptional regulator Fnr [Betaproteobacteria bacterium]|nr:fumarate/nitrate reduction transcriptional regulator Fnr [Betaproteobacteria bacterium]